MTTTRDHLSVKVLRECFRNLQHFRAVFEETQIDVLTGPDGVEICLWDLEYLYEQLPEALPLRQWQAIEWFLVQGLMEEEVAEMMGTAPNNPIGMYATAGLKNILRKIEDGEFDKFGFDRPFLYQRSAA